MDLYRYGKALRIATALTLLAPTTAASQELPRELPELDSRWARGLQDGAYAARFERTEVFGVAGVVSGFALGVGIPRAALAAQWSGVKVGLPLAGIVVLAIASQAGAPGRVDLPAAASLEGDRSGPIYRVGFERAFKEESARRRRAALGRGHLIGVVVGLTYVCWLIAVPST